MANPLFQALGGGQMPGQMGQFQNMVQQFRQFQQTFQGNPKAEVEKLVQSGKITQQQLNKCSKWLCNSGSCSDKMNLNSWPRLR